MATTTNYGWTTPDDTALVKDGASAIRTLGSSVDTTTKALNPSTTLGDVEYRSSTANTNTRLGIGSTGQVLTVAGGVPSWATPTPGGNVSWTLLSTTALSGSSVSLTGLTNNNYFVWLQDWTGSSSGQDVRITLNSNTTAANYDGLYLYPTTFQAQSYRETVGAFDIGNISSTQAGFAEISSAQQSGYKKIRAWTAKTSGGTEYQGTEGFFKSSSVVSSIQIFVTGGTFSGGTAYLYGGS
jgi:hypothetical protein